MKFKFVLLAMLVTCMAGTATAGKFEIGVTGGFSHTMGRENYYLNIEDVDIDLKRVSGHGFTVGLVSRYTWMLENDVFIGAQGEFRLETAEVESSGSAENRGVSFSFDKTWSADILLRVGHKFGETGIYVAGGASFVGIDAANKLTFTTPPFNSSSKDSGTHIGWKAALGVDHKLSERMGIFTQIDYANYGTEHYTFFEARFPKSLEEIAGRIGVVYAF